MAYTQADLDAIDAKIEKIRGVKATSLADRSVTFDLDGLVKERARIAAALAASSGVSRVRYAATSKGV